MPRPTPSRRAVLLGLLASLMLHAAAATTIGWAVRASGPASPTPVPPPETEIQPPRIRPGIERSRNVTITWLGFEEPTEHQAPQSDTEQAQLALRAGGGGVPVPPAPVVPPARSPALAQAAPVEPPAPPEHAAPSPDPAELIASMAAPLLEDMGEWLASATEQAARMAERAPLPAPSAARPAMQPRPERPASQTHAPAAPGAPADRAAEIADRESDARALTEPIEVRLGRPAAAEGLEIRTVRPRWRHATLLTARPRNPVVQVTFGRDGRVRHAAFASVDGAVLSTGYADVDEPLLNAVYRWTARGDALARLPEHAPGLTVSIRIILGG